jgi:hypothetical protein
VDANGRLRGTTPKDVARELLRGSYRSTSILAGAVIVQITALAWLMISLAHDTGIDFTTIPAVSWCIGFAVLATAVAATAARLLLGRHLSALMTVAVLAGWSLLPGTLVLLPVSPYGGPILMLLSVTPMFLALQAARADVDPSGAGLGLATGPGLLPGLLRHHPAERFDAKTTVLIENVTHHIEEEEDEWFPQVRAGLSRKQLQEIGARLEEARAKAPRSPAQPSVTKKTVDASSS